MRQSGKTMASVSAGHIILTPPNQQGAFGHSGDQTQNLLTRSGALYQLSYHAPNIRSKKKKKGTRVKNLEDWEKRTKLCWKI